MDLIIFGGGGHAKVICDMVMDNENDHIIGIVSNDKEAFWSLKHLGHDADAGMLYAKYPQAKVFVAIGDNHIRKKVARMVTGIGWELCNVISRRAIISRAASIPENAGIAVMPGAVINCEVKVGRGCIINTNASVDHEDVFHEFVHIAPGVSVSGRVEIGSETMIGTGACIIDKIRIGSNAVIGAGSAVVDDIPDNCVAVGVPCRVIRQCSWDQRSR